MLTKEKGINFIEQLSFAISTLAVLALFYDFGYNQQADIQMFLETIYVIAMCMGVFSVSIRYSFPDTRPKSYVIFFDLILFLLLPLLILIKLGLLSENPSINLQFLERKGWVYLALFLVFIRELSSSSINIISMIRNPAQLFILSFLSIILAGCGLLLLPNATYTNISFIDALFTSTSAACVTGLVVVDTGSYFTEFGQYVILILIQLGGIGIMTFTSYFSYFFKAGSTYENQLLLSSMTNTEKLGEVFSTLQKIIYITLIIEGAGALLVFQSLDAAAIPSFVDRVFFSVFHSVSGFCNAGFSTLAQNLYEPAFRFNYPLQLIMAFLIIMGGIGFPIVFNLLKFIGYYLKYLIVYICNREGNIRLIHIINVNTRIVLITSLILTVSGTLLIYIFEFNGTLGEHSFWGKIITAFFGSVTTRTAGFNTVDTAALGMPALMIILFLMWVGASPGSTGGGVKTSTLAIAFLNFISLAKGKPSIEIFKAEIAQKSVNRSFAIIVLSFLVISISVFCVSMFDIEKGLLNISFECVSAFGTVGLSRGITAELSNPSKMALIFTMFLGRISMLTIFIAVFKKLAHHKYHYPIEEILIN